MERSAFARRDHTVGKNLFSTGGRAREGGKAVNIPPASPRSGLREAIETLVSSWTLVIGAEASPRRVYTVGENLFSTGGRAREGGKAVGIPPASPRSGFSPRLKSIVNYNGLALPGAKRVSGYSSICCNLRMMERLGCLITRKLRMIVLLARSESKTGCFNHS